MAKRCGERNPRKEHARIDGTCLGFGKVSGVGVGAETRAEGNRSQKPCTIVSRWGMVMTQRNHASSRLSSEKDSESLLKEKVKG